MSRRKKTKSSDELGESIHRTTMRLIRRRLKTATSEEDAERIMEAATSALKEALPKTLADGAVRIADTLDRRRNGLIKDRREKEAGFERRLQQTWGEGFDRLEAHLHAFLEFGEMYSKDGVDADEPPTPALYKALSELHARSCRVVGEIVRLMRAGYADGAHARWRTLHEIAVVAQFLARHGDSMAERYLLHDAVRACRAAERYAQHAETLGFEEISTEELQQLRSWRDDLISRYGKPFGTDFGWAAEQLQQGTPGLAHLEADIDLSHWRPFFGWASDPVHAGPGGLRPLGAGDHGKTYLLAGPSNAGLFDPGQYTVLSMGQILSALVSHRKENLTYLTMYMAFNELGKRCQAALLAAHEFVEQRTAQNWERIASKVARKKRVPRKRRRR